MWLVLELILLLGSYSYLFLFILFQCASNGPKVRLSSPFV